LTKTACGLSSTSFLQLREFNITTLDENFAPTLIAPSKDAKRAMTANPEADFMVD
jgi:hypothetical protein